MAFCSYWGWSLPADLSGPPRPRLRNPPKWGGPRRPFCATLSHHNFISGGHRFGAFPTRTKGHTASTTRGAPVFGLPDHGRSMVRLVFGSAVATKKLPGSWMTTSASNRMGRGERLGRNPGPTTGLSAGPRTGPLSRPVPAIHDIAGLSRRIEVRHHPRNRPGQPDLAVCSRDSLRGRPARDCNRAGRSEPLAEPFVGGVGATPEDQSPLIG